MISIPAFIRSAKYSVIKASTDAEISDPVSGSFRSKASVAFLNGRLFLRAPLIMTIVKTVPNSI